MNNVTSDKEGVSDQETIDELEGIVYGLFPSACRLEGLHLGLLSRPATRSGVTCSKVEGATLAISRAIRSLVDEVCLLRKHLVVDAE